MRLAAPGCLAETCTDSPSNIWIENSSRNSNKSLLGRNYFSMRFKGAESRLQPCCFLLFAPLGRELGGFSEWIFEVDPFIIAGELEQPQNIRWDIVRQMALYMVIIGQIDNLNRVEHIQQYTGCWAV